MKRSKLLVLIATLILAIACVGCYFAFAANNVELTVSGNGSFTVTVDGNLSQNGYSGSISKGSEVTLNATGEGFLYWIDDKGHTVDSAKHTFKADYGQSFEACFKPSTDSLVVYRNSNLTKQIVARATYKTGDTFSDHLVSATGKYGYLFKGWSLTPAQIQEKIGKEAYIEVTPVYEAPAGKYAVAVVNGTISGGGKEGVYATDEKITLVADSAASGKAFCHWEDSNGRIVSEKSSFNLQVYRSDKYTAVYCESGKSGKEGHDPSAWLDLYTIDGIIYSRVQTFIPASATRVEYGLIYIKGSTPSDLEFNLDAVGTNGIRKAAYTADATLLANHFSFAKNDENPYVYVRGYLTYKDSDGATKTVYSGDGATYASINKADDGSSDDLGNDLFLEGYIPEIFDDVVNDPFGGYGDSAANKEYINYNVNSDAVLKTYSNRSEIAFEVACESYIREGYELYGEVNTMGALKSATYVKGSALAHIYYSSNEKELNVIVSDTEGDDLPPETPATTIGSCVTSVTQLPGIGNTSGMGYIIKLADGSFIVYDGGYSAEASAIFGVLKELNGGSDKGIIIRAWLITHGHSDHYSAFESFMDAYRYDVTLEYLMTAPIKGVIDSPLRNLENKLNSSTKVCYVHTGMVFTFCDVKMEILLSPESTFIDGNPKNTHEVYTDSKHPFHDSRTGGGSENETSVISRIKASGNRKTFMILGDAGYAAADKLLALYDDGSETGYLKSDICQVSHHSCESFSIEAYKRIKADIWFYPCNVSLYNNNSSELASGEYVTSAAKGRNWYVLKELKKLGGAHIIRETSEAKGESGYISGDNYQPF